MSETVFDESTIPDPLAQLNDRVNEVIQAILMIAQGHDSGAIELLVGLLPAHEYLPEPELEEELPPPTFVRPPPTDRELAQGWHQHAKFLEGMIDLARTGLEARLCVQRRVTHNEIRKMLKELLPVSDAAPPVDGDEVPAVE